MKPSTSHLCPHLLFFLPPKKTHQQAGPQQNCNKKNLRMSRWRPLVGDGWFQMFSGVVHSQEPRWWQRKYFLGGGNSNIFGIFTPKLGEDFHPIWRAYFSDGWFNHQPVFYFSPRNLGKIFTQFDLRRFFSDGLVLQPPIRNCQILHVPGPFSDLQVSWLVALSVDSAGDESVMSKWAAKNSHFPLVNDEQMKKADQGGLSTKPLEFNHWVRLMCARV